MHEHEKQKDKRRYPRWKKQKPKEKAKRYKLPLQKERKKHIRGDPQSARKLDAFAAAPSIQPACARKGQGPSSDTAGSVKNLLLLPARPLPI